MVTMPATIAEPPRRYGTFANPATGAPERWRLAFVVEALTPAGWMRAAESATLAWAVRKIETRDGLSRAVPRYRVTRGGEVEWTEG